MNVNKVILIGRLTRDPEVRTTKSGQTVTTVAIATNRTYKDQSGQKQEQTEYHNIVLWGRLAEISGQYLMKGQEAYFEGRLQTRSYTGKDNIERRTTEIIAESMQLGNRPGGSNTATTSPAQKIPANTAAMTQNDDAIPTINLDDEKDDIKIEDVPF